MLKLDLTGHSSQTSFSRNIRSSSMRNLQDTSVNTTRLSDHPTHLSGHRFSLVLRTGATCVRKMYFDYLITCVSLLPPLVVGIKWMFIGCVRQTDVHMYQVDIPVPVT